MSWFLPVRSRRKHARVRSDRTATSASNTGTKRRLLFLAGGGAEELRSVLSLVPLGGRAVGSGPDLQRRSIPGMAGGRDAQPCVKTTALRAYVTGLGWK